MKHRSEEWLTDSCEQLGVSPPGGFYPRALAFLDLLDSCSARMNLIGPGEEGRLWERHLLESIAFGPFIPSDRLVDIGTGAGFPGFVLAMLGFRVTMVEPRRKRCAFLETALRECDVHAVVVNGRLEEAGPFPCGTVFTSRGVKRPCEMVRMAGAVSSGDFVLLTRVSHPADIGVSTPLPSPPLDRGGFILQYSHSR